MNIKRIIREEMDNLEWIKQEPITMVNVFDKKIPINTKEAQDNFKKEVHGHYVIATPKSGGEESVIAYGGVPYVKNVIEHMNKSFPEELNLYLGTIKYSKAHKDNILNLIRYY